MGNLLAEKLDPKSLQLSDRQLARLKSRLPEIFSSLGSPLFENYHQLKVDGFKVHVQFAPKIETFLKQSGATVGDVQAAFIKATVDRSDGREGDGEGLDAILHVTTRLNNALDQTRGNRSPLYLFARPDHWVARPRRSRT